MGAKSIKALRNVNEDWTNKPSDLLPETLSGYQTNEVIGPKDPNDYLLWRRVNGHGYTTFCKDKTNRFGNVVMEFTKPACEETELQWFPDNITDERRRTEDCCDRHRKEDYDKDYTSGRAECKRSRDGECHLAQCAHIYYQDARVCKQFDNGTVKSAWATAQKPDEFDGQHGVDCSYRRGDLASSCQAATEYTEAVRSQIGNPLWFDDALMIDLCSRGSSTCPKYGDFDTYAKAGHKCSNIINCSLCVEWKKGMMDSGQGTAVDHIMHKWCDDPANYDTDNPRDASKSDPACRCIKRGSDPFYNKYFEQMKSGLKTPGQCWYKECVDKTTSEYLIPTEDYDHSVCPTNICQQLIDISGGEIEDVDDILIYMDCSQNTSCSAFKNDEQGCSTAKSCEWCNSKCVDSGTCFAPSPSWWSKLTKKEQNTLMLAGTMGALGIGVVILTLALKK